MLNHGMKAALFAAMTSALAPVLTLTMLAPSASAQVHTKPKPPKSLRVYVFDCGQLAIPDTAPYRLKAEDLVTKNMSVACFLVVHPKGVMMWDTGAVPETAFPAGGGPGHLRYATAPKPLRAQLAEVGYTPQDVQYLALSHFHWDHIGNSNIFADTSTWLAREADKEMMFADPPSPRTEPANFSKLRNAKTKFITGDYDVFGDGRVVLKPAPGHSPGHQVLFLKLAKTGPVVVSGDLYHYPEERKLKLIPVNEFNAEQTVASRAAVEAFLQQTGAQLWIQHDLTGNLKLKKAPAFYE